MAGGASLPGRACSAPCAALWAIVPPQAAAGQAGSCVEAEHADAHGPCRCACQCAGQHRSTDVKTACCWDLQLRHEACMPHKCFEHQAVFPFLPLQQGSSLDSEADFTA